MDETKHLNCLAQSHLIGQNAAQTILLLHREVQADFSGIEVDEELVLVFNSRQRIAISIPREWLQRAEPGPGIEASQLNAI